MISLPSWTPGHYEILDYARYIQRFDAVDPGGGPDPEFTATARVRMTAGTGGGGRAALGVDDVALVISGVVIELKRGGGQ